MDEINQANQRIITLFPDTTTDGEPCWVAAIPSCLGLFAQGDTPDEALENLARFLRGYQHRYAAILKPLPPEIYMLILRTYVKETDQGAT